MKSNLVRLYAFNQTTHWFIVGLFFPIMILFLIDKGLDTLQAGTIVAVFSGAVLLLELPTGGLSDSIGRKRVYLLAVSVNLVFALWLIVSWDFLGLVLGFFGIGASRALSSGTIDAWFVDEFKRTEPNGNLQKALARANTVIPIGLAVGSLLGGVIPMTLGPMVDDILGRGIYSANMVVIAVSLAAQFLMTSMLIVEVANKAHESSPIQGLKRFPEVISTSVKYGVKNRIILALVVASFALGVGLISVELLWQPRLKELLVDNDQIWVFGVLSAGYFMAASAGNAIITPLCARMGQNYPLTLVGLRLTMGAALVVIALQGTVIGFAALFLFIMLVNGMSGSPHATIFNSQVPSKSRSTLMSFESFVTQIGVMVGSFTFGFLAKTYSIGSAWVVAGIVLGISAAAYAILATRKYADRIKVDTCTQESAEDLAPGLVLP